MGEREPLRITNVSVFDSIAGRVGGPFDVTIGDGTIISVRPASPPGCAASSTASCSMNRPSR